MTPLATRQLGRTSIRARALALGCAYLGAPAQSDEVAIDTVRRAVEMGLDFVDTSPAYGQSERRLGLALERGWRDKVFLQTKVGTHPARWQDYSAQATRWSVHNSLRVLGTDRLDAVLIHDPLDIEDPLSPGRALGELLKLKDEGLVGYVGLGVRSQRFHRRAIETGRLDVVLTHLDYTLLDQSAAGTTFPLARRHHVGVLLASPLGGGHLSGTAPANDPTAAAMRRWCQDHGLSLRHLAIQFCLSAPIEGLVLTGPANRTELEQVYADATTPVDPGLWRQFKSHFGIVEYVAADTP